MVRLEEDGYENTSYFSEQVDYDDLDVYIERYDEEHHTFSVEEHYRFIEADETPTGGSVFITVPLRWTVPYLINFEDTSKFGHSPYTANVIYLGSMEITASSTSVQVIINPFYLHTAIADHVNKHLTVESLKVLETAVLEEARRYHVDKTPNPVNIQWGGGVGRIYKTWMDLMNGVLAIYGYLYE